MKTVTIDQVMAWNPCEEYTREYVEELFGGCDTLTAREISQLNIPRRDVLWTLLHDGFLTDDEMHEAACHFAELVVHLCDDPRAQAAIDAKRAWLRGKITDDELQDARDAARTAALESAWEAALAAARATAWDARGAAWDAARTATRGTVWEAMMNKQIDYLLSVIAI